jgi:hypothetical protein
MIPGIIISSIFSEQGKLVLHAAPLQFAGAVEAIDNPANGFGVQIAAANFQGARGVTCSRFNRSASTSRSIVR